MPECFRASFGRRIAVIIDCFEIFIEQPSNLLARVVSVGRYTSIFILVFLVRYGIKFRLVLLYKDTMSRYFN